MHAFYAYSVQPSVKLRTKFFTCEFNIFSNTRKQHYIKVANRIGCSAEDRETNIHNSC